MQTLSKWEYLSKKQKSLKNKITVQRKVKIGHFESLKMKLMTTRELAGVIIFRFSKVLTFMFL